MEWKDLDHGAPAPEAADTADFKSDTARAEEREARLADCAEKIWYIDQELEELKEQRKRAIIDVAALVPTDEEVRAADWTLTVEHGERWSWDKDVLEGILEADGLKDPSEYPPYISKSITMNRRKFEDQPDDVRRKYMSALTRHPGQVKVTVSPENPDHYKKA